MALRPDAQAPLRAETKLEPLPSSPLPSSPLPSIVVAFFAVAFLAVVFFAVVFFADTVTPRSAVTRLVSLITSFKDASGK
jgi:hypothetical protein